MIIIIIMRYWLSGTTRTACHELKYILYISSAEVQLVPDSSPIWSAHPEIISDDPLLHAVHTAGGLVTLNLTSELPGLLLSDGAVGLLNFRGVHCTCVKHEGGILSGSGAGAGGKCLKHHQGVEEFWNDGSLGRIPQLVNNIMRTDSYF
jgi:hypothetical protein